MNRENANKILEAYGRPALITKDNNKTIVFARQTPKNIEEIEKMSDAELIEDWKGLVWLNNIYGQVSLSELQRIDLIECEIADRKNIDKEKLQDWFEEAEIKQRIEEEKEDG